MMSATNPVGEVLLAPRDAAVAEEQQARADDRRPSASAQASAVPAARRADVRTPCRSSPGEDESRSRHQQCRNGLDRDVDREVRRSPDQVDGRERHHDLRAGGRGTRGQRCGHDLKPFVMIQSGERTDTLSHHRPASLRDRREHRARHPRGRSHGRDAPADRPLARLPPRVSAPPRSPPRTASCAAGGSSPAQDGSARASPRESRRRRAGRPIVPAGVSTCSPATPTRRCCLTCGRHSPRCRASPCSTARPVPIPSCSP